MTKNIFKKNVQNQNIWLVMYIFIFLILVLKLNLHLRFIGSVSRLYYVLFY